ncbi:hypothetical protein [Mycolicibacterium elephantis]|uniref:zinc finger domain-containing protein n=1 Tax=Mycolicibacterium elephantis TaxID=81858 RepID=UPI001041FD4A|nr:hypothetical protein [Mycolicibacterium elephantis]
MRSRVFEEVYADAAMDRECPNCQAPPHRWCKRPNGETRPIPCIARMRIAAPSAGQRRYPPSPLDVEHQAVPTHPTRSYSEPIHQPDDTED